MLFVFDFITDWYKAQEICEKVASEDPFLIVYCSDRYKTQRMCDDAVDDSLAALKFVPHCFWALKFIPDCFFTVKGSKNFYCFIRRW